MSFWSFFKSVLYHVHILLCRSGSFSRVSSIRSTFYFVVLVVFQECPLSCPHFTLSFWKFFKSVLYQVHILLCRSGSFSRVSSIMSTFYFVVLVVFQECPLSGPHFTLSFWSFFKSVLYQVHILLCRSGRFSRVSSIRSTFYFVVLVVFQECPLSRPHFTFSNRSLYMNWVPVIYIGSMTITTDVFF